MRSHNGLQAIEGVAFYQHVGEPTTAGRMAVGLLQAAVFGADIGTESLWEIIANGAFSRVSSRAVNLPCSMGLKG